VGSSRGRGGWRRAVKTPRIALLTWDGCLSPDSAFGQGLRALGHRWGETLEIVCRSGEGNMVDSPWRPVSSRLRTSTRSPP